MDQQPGTPGSTPPVIPYYGPPTVYTPPPRRRRGLILSLIAVLLAAVITVSAVLVLNTPYRLRGNPGVVAAYEYACEYMKQGESLTGGTVGADIVKRLGAEPFEIECALSVASEQFEDSGIPLKSIPVGIDIKYDMTDFGLQISAMGFQVLGAYVIGDDFAVDIAGEAGSTQIDLPIEADLDEPMALTERFAAFLPFLAEEHNELYFRILEAFAQSVPDEYTDTYTLDIYSPAAGKDINTLVVETELDSSALAEVIRSFAGLLRDDEELVVEIQTLADEVTEYFDLKPTDIIQMLDEMARVDESDIAGAELSWQVYKREGRYSGMSVTAYQPDTGTMTMLSEFHNNIFYTSERIESDGITTESYTVNTVDGNRIEIEAETTSTAEFMSSTIQQSGSVEYARVGADEYTAELEMTINQASTYTDDDIDDTRINADLTGDIEFQFGSDLKTLKESPGWNDIYGEEWGSLEDAMQGLFNLGEMLGGSLDIL